MSEKEKLNEEEKKSTQNNADTETENEVTQDPEKADNNRKILIAEIAIVVIAVIAIVVALIVSSRGNSSVSDNSVSAPGTVSSPTAVTVDNSLIYEMPAIPSMDEFNTLTEADCEANVANGTMIKLDCADGSYIYVNNYLDEAYFAEQTAYTQEEIDEYIFIDILSYYGTVEETDRTQAELWDTVSINYVGTLNGVAFEGGTADNYNLTLGSGQFIDGFEDGVIGMNVGETKDLTLTFPEEYPAADLAGQEVIFTVTLNSIVSATSFPELNDEMVMQASGGALTTVSECQAYYAEILLQDKIWSFVDENFYTSAISEETLTYYYNTTMDYYDAVSTSQQIDIATMLSYYQLDLEVFKQDVLMTSAESARYSALYHAIAEANHIEITEEDIALLATDYGYTDTATFLADYGEQSVMDYILQSKVMDYLVSLSGAQ